MNTRRMQNKERKDRIRALLKGIETGDPESVTVVHPERYIQHNPQTLDDGPGLAELFKKLSERNPKVRIVRLFSDGDFVFGHTEYNFGTPKVGFEVFRFEGEHTVEHWDNIQVEAGPNRSDHTMTGGASEAQDQHKTEAHREIVRSFISEVIVNGNVKAITQFIDTASFTEHNPAMGDDLKELIEAIEKKSTVYETTHRILADGNYVLTVNEGTRDGVHSSFYDLFRLEDGRIVEHWDTTEKVPPREQWKNNNGKF